MDTPTQTRPNLTRSILRLYITASFQYRADALFSLLNPIGAILTNVGVPFYASKALVSSLQNSGDFRAYTIRLVIVGALAIIANRVGFIRLMALQAKTMNYLHRLVFNRLLDRGVAFHTNQIGGKLVSDALDFVSAYGTMIMAVYNGGISLAAILLSGLVIVAINSWQLGLFLTMVVTVTIVWAYIESLRRNELRSIRLQATKKLTGHLSDSIVNAQTVKTFAGEDFERAQNKRLNKVLFGLRLKDWRRAAISGNNRISFLIIMVVFLLLLVRHTAQANPAMLSTGIFAFTYTFTLIMRLFEINTLTRQVEESFLQATPIMQNLLEDDEIADIPDAQDLAISAAEISVRSVGFTYADDTGNQEVFHDLNLLFKSGEKVGLIGPSGSGKTTLTRLLLRFEDPQQGSIQIDNQDIAKVTQKSLRQNVAYVPQEPLLFHRSIKDNIAYGNPEASMSEITRAATLAYADDFIKELPKGYDTIVGERGVKLSGGQRQRVAIARAILKNSPILVFDEATSALDSESEKVIQAALSELMANKTTLVIAHRLSTIQKMDRIIVMESGKIVEQGTHKELLAKKGLYATLWAHQSGGFLED